MQDRPCQHDTHAVEHPTQGMRSIEPLELKGNEQVADLIDNVYARSGYNARRLAEAAHLFRHMIDENATICMTVAGAMTPIGMSGIINTLIRAGFVDCLICTGANLYHDMHRPFGLPMVQGQFMVDDNELAAKGIARIYDVFIEEHGTLMATDEIILEAIRQLDASGPLSTAQLHYSLGNIVRKNATQPQGSILATAAEYELPIYTSSPGDSSIAMNLAVPHLFNRPVQLDPLKDVLETAAIVRSADSNGVVIVGGGSPKNFYLQTQPTIAQIFMDSSRGGHDYFIQLGVDSPQWGGLSGATPSEARSWGKVKDAMVNNVVVYSCASLTLPLLAQYVLTRNKPRTPKRLYGKLPTMMAEFRDAAEQNPEFQATLKRLRLN